MTYQSESADTMSEDAGHLPNIEGTCEPVDTTVTQRCSLSDLVPDLIAMRNKHGAGSQIGGICSNIVEMIDNLPPPPETWIDYMMPDWVPEIWNRLRRNIAAQMVVLRGLIHEPQ